MLKIEYQGQFKKDFKSAVKMGFDISEFQKVVSMLANRQPRPVKYKDHALTVSREYKDVRECHIKPDWLLIYRICDDELVLMLIRTGTHSDLF